MPRLMLAFALSMLVSHAIAAPPNIGDRIAIGLVSTICDTTDQIKLIVTAAQKGGHAAGSAVYDGFFRQPNTRGEPTCIVMLITKNLVVQSVEDIGTWKNENGATLHGWALAITLQRNSAANGAFLWIEQEGQITDVPGWTHEMIESVKTKPADQEI